MLERRDKIHESLARKSPARKAERVNGTFDRGRLSFDFDQHVHAGIGFEADRRFAQLVLRNLTIDFPGQLQPQPQQYLLE